MSRIDELREQALELRIEERELVEQETAIAEKLAINRAEQARVKAMLVTNAKTSMRLQSETSKSSARGAIAKMGSFTLGEAATELGWTKARVKKLLDAMACEVPPAIVPDGKFGTTPMFKYTGPPISAIDPVAERETAALEAVREWIVTQTTAFTPFEVAAAVDIPRATALRALRTLQGVDAIIDIGPTADMPIFRLTGQEPPDVTPELKVVESQAPPLSKIPQIQEILTAAKAAGCDIVPSNGHFAIEALDGRRVVIGAVPAGRKQMLENKARLRRIGVNV